MTNDSAMNTWEDLGRKDAIANVYKPPTNSDRARQNYQYGWENNADDAAWKVRMTEEEGA